MHLTLLWLLPAAGCAAAWLMPGRRSGRAAAMAVSVAVLAYSLWLMVPFAAGTGVLRLEGLGPEGPFGIRYRVAADGVSLSLCWLTALLTVLGLAGSWNQDLKPGFWASFLALEAALMGVFTVQSLFYFFVFWDLALIPMFFIIGLWGSDNRRHAALKFVLYTFLGSLALLVGIVALPILHHSATGAWTWDMAALAGSPAGASPLAPLLFCLFVVGFGVKIPLWPLHNWLPDAHTEAPAAGSVLLAGAMLKMGVYGFIRVVIPVFPGLSAALLPVMGGLAVVNILYGALCAMAQADLKRLVAFTSISHLGFCVLGLFSLTAEGMAGASLQMLNHGLSTGALFLLIGMLYERCHRRRLSDFGGLARTTPWFAFFFAVVILSSIGLPGLNGFVGEALALLGAAKASPALAALGLVGTVLAAAYGLPAYQKAFWDPPGPASVSAGIKDMDGRERGILWVLTALIVWIGLNPQPLLALLEPALSPMVAR